jgi:hypothetical protein
MLHKSNNQYINWLLYLKQKIQQSQIKATFQVNSASAEMYWDLEKEIAERNFESTYDCSFFLQLSRD